MRENVHSLTTDKTDGTYCRPVRAPFAILRAWRVMKQVPVYALTGWWRAFLNEGQLLSFALAVMTSWLAIRTANLARVIEEASGWLDAAQALFYVAGAWAILCIVRAPFAVLSDERKLGRWHKHRFVYNSPLLVATERFEHAEGATQCRAIRFAHAGPNAFVYTRIVADPPVVRRVLTRFINGAPLPDFHIVPPVPGIVTMNVPPGVSVGFRVGSKSSSNLYARVEPATVPVILRVYVHSFFLGKDDAGFQ